MFQLLLIFSTDFWNNAPLIFHRNCQFWLERVKETNVCSDLVLQHGPTSRAMPRGNHNINIKWGTKSQGHHSTPYRDLGPIRLAKTTNLCIDCLKLPKTFPINVVNVTGDLRKVFFKKKGFTILVSRYENLISEEKPQYKCGIGEKIGIGNNFGHVTQCSTYRNMFNVSQYQS